MLNITDPGFQDFRTDATCIIRPQSLLGEKFVDCKPTLARSSLTEPPPSSAVIADGEAGEGQHLPAAREQRQGRRHRPRQQHLPRARGRQVPAHPQRPRRRPRGPRRHARRSDRARQPGAAADRQGAGDPRRAEPAAGPARRSTPTPSWRRWRASGSGSPASSRTRRSPARPRRAPGRHRAGLRRVPERAARARADDGPAAASSRRRRRRSRPTCGSAPRASTGMTEALGPFANAGTSALTHASATRPRRAAPTSSPPRA